MREAWCELGNIRQTVEGWREDFVTAFSTTSIQGCLVGSRGSHIPAPSVGTSANPIISEVQTASRECGPGAWHCLFGRMLHRPLSLSSRRAAVRRRRWDRWPHERCCFGQGAGPD